MNNSSSAAYLSDLPLAGELVSSDRAEWPSEIEADFVANAMNGNVGTRLLSESDHVRVWEIRVAPGDRVPAHRHVLDYFWTAVVPGRSRQRTFDGTTREVSYVAGETRHYTFAEGEYLLHDLENVGETELIFTTVEFLDSKNAPLSL
ncbi:MAG: hypothetical protein LBE25_08980 [Arthrobacter sp.]|jgi:hypothetical protein|nr:hypothetical protein [Arthrobacter sp.]